MIQGDCASCGVDLDECECMYGAMRLAFENQAILLRAAIGVVSDVAALQARAACVLDGHAGAGELAGALQRTANRLVDAEKRRSSKAQPRYVARCAKCSFETSASASDQEPCLAGGIHDYERVLRSEGAPSPAAADWAKEWGISGKPGWLSALAAFIRTKRAPAWEDGWRTGWREALSSNLEVTRRDDDPCCAKLFDGGNRICELAPNHNGKCGLLP